MPDQSFTTFADQNVSKTWVSSARKLNLPDLRNIQKPADKPYGHNNSKTNFEAHVARYPADDASIRSRSTRDLEEQIRPLSEVGPQTDNQIQFKVRLIAHRPCGYCLS